MRGDCPPELAAAEARDLQRAKRHFEDEGRVSGFTFRAYHANGVKEALVELGRSSCAYCEADYDATAPVDAEHFRPKGGVEIDGDLVQPGYWWLAGSWDNLLPSCIRCNRQEHFTIYDGRIVLLGKGNLFPLEDETARGTRPGAEVRETPLLINPCLEDPTIYIGMADKDGDWLAVPMDHDPQSLSSRRALASIDAYGLNRPGLVRVRSIYFNRAKLAVAQLRRAARRLDGIPTNNAEERDDVAIDVELALAQLRSLTSGDDSYSGSLRTFIAPQLADLNIALWP